MASLSWDEMTAGKRIARGTAACCTAGRVGRTLLALLLAAGMAVPAALAQPAGRGMGTGSAAHAESHRGGAAGQDGHGPSSAGAAGAAETGTEAGIGRGDADGDDAPGAGPASDDRGTDDRGTDDQGTASPGEDAPGDGDAPDGRATEATSDQPASPAPPGAGEVGLIEAPENATGVDADLLPATPDEAAADGSGYWRHGAGQPAAAGAGPTPAFLFGPIEHPPVVVELFTSQGCSACPPADQMLAELAGRRDVLALSWHVDYWDYLGWADQFARPEFTRRQQAYAHAAGERAIYTPQMIVGGSDTLLSVRPAELMSLIEAQMARPVPVLVTARREAEGYRIELAPRAELPGPIGIVLVRYAPERRVTIRAGENRGISVTYRNIVLDATRIGEWDGRAPLRMTVKASPPGDAFPEDTRHAILAQELDDDGDGDGDASGPILAAIRLD